MAAKANNMVNTVSKGPLHPIDEVHKIKAIVAEFLRKVHKGNDITIQKILATLTPHELFFLYIQKNYIKDHSNIENNSYFSNTGPLAYTIIRRILRINIGINSENNKSFTKQFVNTFLSNSIKSNIKNKKIYSRNQSVTLLYNEPRKKFMDAFLMEAAIIQQHAVKEYENTTPTPTQNKNVTNIKSKRKHTSNNNNTLKTKRKIIPP